MHSQARLEAVRSRGDGHFCPPAASVHLQLLEAFLVARQGYHIASSNRNTVHVWLLSYSLSLEGSFAGSVMSLGRESEIAGLPFPTNTVSSLPAQGNQSSITMTVMVLWD